MSLSTAEPAEVRALADALVAARDRLAGDDSIHVSDALVQQLLSLGTQLYVRKLEQERRHFLPVDSQAITATEAVTVMSGMLEAVNLSVFDLSMWVDGRPR